MKISNPTSRYDLSIKKSDNVLEVGGGHNPHPRSNVVVDKFVDSNYHRKSDIKTYENQSFINADGENLPFDDKEFDFVICNQVLEHVENPERFLKEQMRVAKRGYIETPSLIGEYLFPKKSHKWVVLEINSKLVLVEKSRVWPERGPDFGSLFLHYLPKHSVGFKILERTHPGILNTTYQWEGEIEWVVNPESDVYLKYFNKVWDDEMIRNIFPERTILQELSQTASAIFSIVTRK